VKEFLSREGYPFLERNVEEDEDAYRALLAGGWMTVPLTMIGSRAVKGYDEARLRDALRAAAGRPRDR
jgi:hypothetical protein